MEVENLINEGENNGNRCKCSRIQSKYFYGMLTGSLPEMLRDKYCLLSLPVFDWFSTVNTGQPIPTCAGSAEHLHQRG